MKSIWKYTLPVEDTAILYMPPGAEVLTIQSQGGVLCLWAYVDTELDGREVRLFHIRGTGNPLLGNEGTYVGTAQIGPFVWHVFEGAA
jgi:hypothetical protein